MLDIKIRDESNEFCSLDVLEIKELMNGELMLFELLVCLLVACGIMETMLFKHKGCKYPCGRATGPQVHSSDLLPFSE